MRRSIQPKRPKKLVEKSVKRTKIVMAIILITLGLLGIAKNSYAQSCEGECFSAKDARDCVEAQRKWETCKSELVKCNEVESENEQLAGRLNECRKASKEKDKLLMHWSQKSGRLKEERNAAREKNMWYFLGGAATAGTVTIILFFVAK